MSPHVASMLQRYRPDFSVSQFTSWINDFQKEFRSLYDLGFVGDVNHVAAYTLEIPLEELSIPSMASDLMKHDSIMSRFLFVLIHCR